MKPLTPPFYSSVECWVICVEAPILLSFLSVLELFRALPLVKLFITFLVLFCALYSAFFGIYLRPFLAELFITFFGPFYRIYSAFFWPSFAAPTLMPD
jgi:hypothetical protein